MSSRRDWNSVVAAAPPPPAPSAPAAAAARPSLQRIPRQTTSSSAPCRYTKAEMLLMFAPSDRPPADYQCSLPIVSSECQAPVTAEPPSPTERDILESGTWYMPSARPAPNSSATSVKPGRSSATRPTRTTFSRRASTANDDAPPSDYRPTRFNWRNNNDSCGPGANDTDAIDHRRASIVEKSSSRGIGRSDAALSWRRDDNEGGNNTTTLAPVSSAASERTETEPAAAAPDSSVWRSPTIQSRRQSAPVADSQPTPPVQDKFEREPPLIEEGVECRDSWWYQDPSGTVRGPFSPDEMRDWYQQNYFQLTLPVRCRPDRPFIPLGALFLQGDPAFLDHVPVVMAAPVEPARRPTPLPPAPPQPFLHHRHLQPNVMPMFPPQPPSYFPHTSFVTAPPPPATHSDSMFRSAMPFAPAPIAGPVLDQPVESWMTRQAPIQDVLRQSTPWMPFSSPAPVPTPLSVAHDLLVEQQAPEPISAPIAPAAASASIPRPSSSSSLLTPVEVAADPAPSHDRVQYGIQSATPSDSVDRDLRPASSMENVQAQSDRKSLQNAVCSDADVPLPTVKQAPVSGSTASSVQISASEPSPNVSAPAAAPSSSTAAAATARPNGWATPAASSSSSSAPKKSLLEIQREEEELHRINQQALKVQQEAQREVAIQAVTESVGNLTCPWGSAASSSPSPRSLLEIQKQQELMQATVAPPRPAASGWVAKVAPLASSSWGSTPKPATLSMRQIQEEEQRVLCRQQQQQPQKDGAPVQSGSGWSAAVAGSAWARSAPSAVNQTAARTASAAAVTSSAAATRSAPAASQQQSESGSESDDDSPFWGDAKTTPSSKDNSGRAKNEFGGPVMSAEFREWCQTQLAAISNDCDVSLAEFLLTLESSEAVREYIYQYLGRSSEVEAFATGFLQHKDFDDPRPSRSHAPETSKASRNDSQDPSKKKKNRRRRKKKSDYP